MKGPEEKNGYLGAGMPMHNDPDRRQQCVQLTVTNKIVHHVTTSWCFRLWVDFDIAIFIRNQDATHDRHFYMS